MNLHHSHIHTTDILLINLHKWQHSLIENNWLIFVSSFWMQVAPLLFQSFSTIPYISQVSFIGTDGLFLSYYKCRIFQLLIAYQPKKTQQCTHGTLIQLVATLECHTEKLWLLLQVLQMQVQTDKVVSVTICIKPTRQSSISRMSWHMVFNYIEFTQFILRSV